MKSRISIASLQSSKSGRIRSALARAEPPPLEYFLIRLADTMDGCPFDARAGHSDDIETLEHARIAVQHAVRNES